MEGQSAGLKLIVYIFVILVTINGNAYVGALNVLQEKSYQQYLILSNVISDVLYLYMIISISNTKPV